MIICNTIKLFKDITGMMTVEELKELGLHPKFDDGGFSTRQLKGIKTLCDKDKGQDYHIITVTDLDNILRFDNKFVDTKKAIRYYIGRRMTTEAHYDMNKKEVKKNEESVSVQ